ncbi:helix-turn-helix domain-containing protein [Brachybacterium muris]|uniref:helix-turn-helix domain-containing protein n=1 Tax=Brachybacterium muris TaxID=219301 RepID=UPI00223C1B52|nr:helix-turn-helix domain-containing protein [Brachybacterium muris]
MKGTSKIQYPTRLRRADLTLAERAVLLDLWTYSDADMTNAWPTKARIADDCNMSRDGVRKALRSLETKGYIIPVKRGGWTEEGNRATNYSLTLPGMGATQSPPVGDQEAPRGGTQSPLPDPSPDPVSDPPIAVPVPATQNPPSRSPSLSERRSDLLEAVKEISRATTDDEYEAASEAFIAALEDAHGEDIGFWDYGWSNSLDRHVRDHGIDYGSAKWLSIFTNTRNAA